MKLSGTITKVSGPLVVANGLADANVSDVVRVGEQRLIGEILNMTGDSASIQVYEETSGLGPGAKVETTGMPLSVELGPGMLENIYDGIQRPLPEIRDLTGSNITRGIEVPALNRERVWHFDPVVQPGTAVTGGDVIGTVQETTAILHKIMVPPQMKGTIKSITGGDFTVDQTVAVLTDAAVSVDMSGTTLIVARRPQPPPAVATVAFPSAISNCIIRRLTLSCTIGAEILIDFCYTE